jgi:hypothetical protein
VFNGTVKKENYLGTINGAASSINVTLPDVKFYTIVAVEREAYEEFGDNAFQSSILTYYSNSQGYTVTLTPNGLGGNAIWRMHNRTKYWVELRSQDSSETYAVIAPQTYYVNKPIMLDTQYRYIPHFYRELKYSGKIVAIVETTSIADSDTAIADDISPIFETTIENVNVPAESLRPTILVNNDANKTIDVYYSNRPLTNGAGAQGVVIPTGRQQLLSGLEADQNVNQINFRATAWGGNHKYVTNDVTMVSNKVYIINVTDDGAVLAASSEEKPNPGDIEDYID